MTIRLFFLILMTGALATSALHAQPVQNDDNAKQGVARPDGRVVRAAQNGDHKALYSNAEALREHIRVFNEQSQSMRRQGRGRRISS